MSKAHCSLPIGCLAEREGLTLPPYSLSQCNWSATPLVVN